MTREEIMQMGRQAGSFIELAQEKDLLWLERFAKLVAQHERERAVWTQKHWTEYEHNLVAAEREACAKVCDDINAKYKWPDDVAERVASQWCADSIRARGQA